MERIIQTTKTLLKKSERYTKTDMLYLFKGSFWLGVGQVFASLSGLFISVLFANFLPKEIYGNYKFILSIISIFSLTTLTGIDTAVTQAVARGYEGTLIPGLKFKIKWGICGALSALCTGGYYFSQGNMIFGYALIISGFFIPFLETFDIYKSLLSGRKLFHIHTITNIFSQTISVITLGLALFFTHNLVIIIFCFLITNSITNIIGFFYTIKTCIPNKKTDPETLQYGTHLSFTYLIGTILMEFDKILIFHFLGASDLAAYTLTIAPPEQIKGLLKNTQTIAMPKFATKHIQDIRKTIINKISIYIGIIISITLLYVLSAPLIFKILFPQYHEAVFYTQIYSFTLIGSAISSVFYGILEAKAIKKAIYINNIFSNICGLFLSFICIYFWGLLGVVIAKVITRNLTALLSGILVYRVK